ncbi:MAG: methylcobalamin:coenzyme M methyltransferase [Actinobacteria bacterium ADurb.Bin346]|nr:MAG: methylcobalamin:coenzyme M methyltransferase [Actinobacteria bacterium ADurb.Bin346]
MVKIKPRERVITAYNHREPDRVPICIGGVAQKFTKPVYYSVKERLGITSSFEKEDMLDELNSIIHYDPKVLDYFNVDFREIHINKMPPLEVFEDGSWKHELGMTLKVSLSGETANFITHPFRELDAGGIKKFKWPDPSDKRRIEGLKDEASRLYNETDFAIGAYKATLLGIFDCAWTMRSMDKFFVDLVFDKNLVNVLLDKILEFNYGVYDLFLSEVGQYVNVVEFNDDLGSQSNLMISPDQYREFIKPRHKTMIDMFRKRAPQAKVLIHSCGSIHDIIPDFIEIGIDIINPVQPLAAKMNTSDLKKEFGNDICFQGGIDLQKAMRGTFEDVEREVKERIASLAPGGGYVLSSANNIASDIPVDNVFKLYEAAVRYGTYPINFKL